MIHGVNVISLILFVQPGLKDAFPTKNSVVLFALPIAVGVIVFDQFWFYGRKEKIKERFQKRFPEIPFYYILLPLAYAVVSFGGAYAVGTYWS
jgi:hypothetical protein